MYSFEEARHFNLNYWIEAKNRLDNKNFIDYKHSYQPFLQIGVWIIERADLVIHDEIIDPSDLKKPCIDVVTQAILLYPHEVQNHIKMTFGPGAFNYGGLFDLTDFDIKNMWDLVLPILEKYSELSILTNLVAMIYNNPEIPSIIKKITLDLEDNIEFFDSYAKLPRHKRKIIKSLQKMGYF